MNNYEKIKLALFAIDHEAYIVQEYIKVRELLPEFCECDASGFTKQRMDDCLKLLEGVIKRLGEIMEDLANCVDAMDGNMLIDLKLMEIPYDIVYGRKTEADYENLDIIEQNANKENAL